MLSIIIRKYIDHMKFAAYMVVCCIIFFHIHSFVSLCICLYALCACVQFSSLCIFIVMFVFYYCYERMFRSAYSVSLCSSMYCL
jgi:hypothetical protein